MVSKTSESAACLAADAATPIECLDRLKPVAFLVALAVFKEQESVA